MYVCQQKRKKYIRKWYVCEKIKRQKGKICVCVKKKEKRKKSVNKKKEIDLVTGQQFKNWAGPYSAHYYPAPISVWTKKHPIIPSPKLSLSVCTKAHSIVLSPKRCVSVDHEFKVLLQSLFPIQSIHFQVRYNRLDVEKITRNFFFTF